MLSRLKLAFHDLSIRRKLTLIITLTSSLALVLACAGFVLNDVLTFQKDERYKANTYALMVASNTSAALEFADERAAAEMLGFLANEPRVIGAAVYSNGKLLARYWRPDVPGQPPANPPTPGTVQISDGRLEVARTVVSGEHTVGTVYLAMDLGQLDDRLRRYLLIAAGLLFAATVAAYGLSSAFQPVVSRPLIELVDIAHRVSRDKDFSMRAPVRSRDEIGQLFAGFNEMLSQIQQRDAALRAAHGHLELRVLERTRELEQQISERLAAEKALQQQLTRISLLNQIANALSDRQDLDRIVRVVLAELEAHLPVDFGSVSLFNPATEALEVAASRRRGSADAGSREELAPRGPIAGAFAGLEECRAGRHVCIADTFSAEPPLARRFAGGGFRSVVVVPLILEHRLFGVLAVARREAHAFTSGEAEFLRVLGEQVAVAGSQAHLYVELQRAYTELRQSQRAMMQQERLRALGQMASGIAHDINNNLTPIVTFADILLNDPKTKLDPTTREYLKNIQTAGVDIGSIVARLREFYRPRDSAEPHLPVKIHPLLRQVADLTRPRWRDMPQAKGIVIELRLELAADPFAIAGNETELREGLINLVLNAVDAMPQGGLLTLRTRHEPGPNGHHEGNVVVEVIDTGIGMDEETRQRCLEPFFSTKGQLGTGLGLASVYGVVERHGGRIEIESALGRGTTMRLILPTLSSSGAGGVSPVDQSQDWFRLRILCVDDEPMLRRVLSELFRLDGHEVAVAEGGEAGLKLFHAARAESRPFDVVITDLGMPHMDGRQFAQAIKRVSPTTPVLLLTGWGKIMKDEGDSIATVDAVLSKPPRVKELRRVLQQLCVERVRPGVN